MKTAKNLLLVILVSLYPAVVLSAQSDVADGSGSRVIPVRYSEETELLAVVCHLADIGGYDFSEEDGVLSDYLSDVDSCFAPFRNHKAVKFAAERLYRRGFSYDLPMALALRLTIDDGHLKYNEGLVDDFDGYYERISRPDEKKFIALLEDFYHQSSFREFFNSHMKVYRECEEAMREVVDKLDMGWYDSFFGPIEDVEFCVYLGLLNGPGNFAIHQKNSDGTELVNALMGCCDRDSDGKIYYGEVYTLPVLVHEFNHSYCNPMNEEIWDSIRQKANAIFSENAEFYSSIAYGAPEYIMNEMFVEASMIRYLTSHPLDLSGSAFNGMDELIDRLILVDDKKKFSLVRTMIDVLGRREAEQSTYPTMRDFLPEYVKAINAE